MSLRERLRSETRTAHNQLETQLNLIRDDFDEASYVHLLERFYGYLEPCEAQLVDLSTHLQAFFVPRRKTPLLAADLRQLGPTDESLRRISRCEVVDLRSMPGALGRWYVLEGSTLGSQLLCQRFEATLPAVRSALSYFRSYGPDVGRMWKDYCQLLDSSSSPATDDLVVRAAQQTFCELGNWFK